MPLDCILGAVFNMHLANNYKNQLLNCVKCPLPFCTNPPGYLEGWRCFNQGHIQEIHARNVSMLLVPTSCGLAHFSTPSSWPRFLAISTNLFPFGNVTFTFPWNKLRVLFQLRACKFFLRNNTLDWATLLSRDLSQRDFAHPRYATGGHKKGTNKVNSSKEFTQNVLSQTFNSVL